MSHVCRHSSLFHLWRHESLYPSHVLFFLHFFSVPPNTSPPCPCICIARKFFEHARAYFPIGMDVKLLASLWASCELEGIRSASKRTVSTFPRPILVDRLIRNKQHHHLLIYDGGRRGGILSSQSTWEWKTGSSGCTLFAQLHSFRVSDKAGSRKDAARS